jgi:hypothetical protein
VPARCCVFKTVKEMLFGFVIITNHWRLGSLKLQNHLFLTRLEFDTTWLTEHGSSLPDVFGFW